MLSSARLGVLGAALLTFTTATSAVGGPAVAPVEAATGRSVSVHGRLLVVPAETPGGHPAYGVALADGDIVPVRGSFGPDVRTGAVFDGRLGLPAGVLAALTRHGESGPAAALRVIDRRSLSLPVLGSPTITDAPDVSPAVTPTTHQQYVAAIDNLGALGQTDAQLLGHVTNVGSYWTSQANGAIAAITVPGSVKHYDTAVGTAACGLGSGQTDFFNLVQEAMDRFPGISPFDGTDQLVLFVPGSCSSGSTVGRGTLGTSLASGGALIVKATASIEGIYAHETGHNYGFQHANGRVDGTRSLEYYGVYDVMGFAINGWDQLTALSTPYRVFQGITASGEIQDVDLGNGLTPVHATATIRPRSDTSGLRSVRVEDPDTGAELYVDYRSGTGEDSGAFYTNTSGFFLTYDNGSKDLYYAPGVTISAARTVDGHPNGVDVLADASGHTAYGAGSAWVNASGLLTVSVSAVTPTAATVSVDYLPPQAFTTVGTPVIGGTVAVGGTVTLDTGSWDPAPTSSQVRWTADGQAVPSLNGLTQFTAAPALVGKQLVATVTASKPGYETTSAQSSGATVGAGTIATTTGPSITGTAKVGFSLHASTGTWSPVLSPVTTSFRWQRDGVDIAGASAQNYQVTPGDVGAAITVVQTVAASGYQTVTLTSSATGTVPEPVIDPAGNSRVTGTPRVGGTLTADAGSWMAGVGLSYQWFVAGVPVVGATGTTYRPTADDLGRTVRVEVTGTRADYPAVTHASAETVPVAPGVLSASTPTIGGTPEVGKTLTARHHTWTRRTTFRYAWYASGTVIRHQTASTLTLTKAQRGKRITVKVTGTKPGYTTVSRTSAKTPRVR